MHRHAASEAFQFCHFTGKSDVWIYGVLMWEIFTHVKLPYADICETNEQVRVALATEWKVE